MTDFADFIVIRTGHGNVFIGPRASITPDANDKFITDRCYLEFLLLSLSNDPHQIDRLRTVSDRWACDDWRYSFITDTMFLQSIVDQCIFGCLVSIETNSLYEDSKMGFCSQENINDFIDRDDYASRVTVFHVEKMFPETKANNIENQLDYVIDGLKTFDIADRAMILVALATIRAETEGFLPISEGVSKYNTVPGGTAFGLYDKGTSKGKDLGNVEVGDGKKFRGRGFVQLTGRYNYKKYGEKVGINLIDDPDMANDPATAGLLLAAFLADHATSIRANLEKKHFKSVRKAVNGGSHGYDRFKDALDRGDKALPVSYCRFN